MDGLFGSACHWALALTLAAMLPGSPLLAQLRDPLGHAVNPKALAAGCPGFSATVAESIAAAAAAAAPGFDRARYEACIRLRKSAGIVTRDQALGKQLGITGTPTLFINGRRYLGMASAAMLTTDLAAAGTVN
ncbi:MAG: DsbA family protein [Terriglobales bacterium]